MQTLEHAFATVRRRWLKRLSRPTRLVSFCGPDRGTVLRQAEAHLSGNPRLLAMCYSYYSVPALLKR